MNQHELEDEFGRLMREDKPPDKFRVMTVAEFMNSGPPLLSREHKLAVQAEERAKDERERQRRKRLAKMTPEDIARERRIFEQCEYIAQIKRRLTNKQDELNKERLPTWLL